MQKNVFTVLALALLLFGACTENTPSVSIPLPEHPRPDFERSAWQNLNGYWSFTFDSAAADKALAENSLDAFDQRILVPFPWGSKLSEVEDKGDVAWYGRDVTVPKSWKGKRVFALMTHEGSGLGHCERDLKKVCVGATVGKGLAVHGADAARSEGAVATWARKCV